MSEEPEQPAPAHKLWLPITRRWRRMTNVDDPDTGLPVRVEGNADGLKFRVGKAPPWMIPWGYLLRIAKRREAKLKRNAENSERDEWCRLFARKMFDHGFTAAGVIDWMKRTSQKLPGKKRLWRHHTIERYAHRGLKLYAIQLGFLDEDWKPAARTEKLLKRWRRAKRHFWQGL